MSRRRRRLFDLGAHPPLEADHVLLACGLPQARPDVEHPSVETCEHYVADPWDISHYEAFVGAEHIRVIGTGLTMLDVLVGLDRHGFAGKVLAISRHGLGTSPARVAPPRPGFIDPEHLPSRARALSRQVQKARREIAAAGADWQSPITTLRAHVPALWDNFGEEDQRLFLRRLRPYSEVSRHRADPRTARLADAWRAEGRLEVMAGQVRRLSVGEDGSLCVEVRFRATATPKLLAPDGVINCTGTQYDVVKAAATRPFLMNLLENGVIRPGPLSFGIDARKDGAVPSRSGEAQARLTAIGPLLRGGPWESTSIPEILAQVPSVVARLAPAARSLSRRAG